MDFEAVGKNSDAQFAQKWNLLSKSQRGEQYKRTIILV